MAEKVTVDLIDDYDGIDLKLVGFLDNWVWVSEQDLRRVSPAAQEVVRLRVVDALESGLVRSYPKAAAMFGVSSRSVGTWWRKYRDSGRESLAAPVKSRTGRE